jgi:hypothetical protein
MPKFVKANDENSEEPMSFLLYGRSGTGKSKSLNTINRPILYIRHPMEPTHNHFKGRDDVIIVQLSADQYGSCWEDFQASLQFISKFKQTHPTGVVVVDSITALSQDFEMYLKAKNKRGLEMRDWGMIYDELFKVVRMCKVSGLHCVVILWADVMRERVSGVSMVQPYTKGSMGQNLPHYFSETIYAFTNKEKNELRYLWQHSTNDTAVARTMVEGMTEFTNQDFNIYFK